MSTEHPSSEIEQVKDLVMAKRLQIRRQRTCFNYFLMFLAGMNVFGMVLAPESLMQALCAGVVIGLIGSVIASHSLESLRLPPL